MVKHDFNSFAQSFANQIAERGVWICDHLVSTETLLELFNFANRAHEDGKFRPAKIGKREKKQLNSAIRKDSICWIQDWSVLPLASIHEILLQIEIAAKRELFLPLKRFEAHLSRYAPGAFYKPHTDRHKKLPSRLLSMVLYLNDVEEHEGGQLLIQTDQEKPLMIQPRAGRLVIFDSRLMHEVKKTQKLRWSLTCWFRDDAVVGIEGI